MQNLNLILVIHNHQPCDNFNGVFESAYERAYKPFLDTLEKYPRIKVVMHYSGGLLEWLDAKRPEFMEQLKRLLANRQIELLSGGFYEPVLAVIPDRDKIGQINLQTEFIKNYFSYLPKGAWIAERVWDERLSEILLKCSLEYTVLDESHLVAAGVPTDKLDGYYTTSQGLHVLGVNKKLRYIMPFAKVKDVIEYFKSLAVKNNNPLYVFGDDGEKFGLWPHTYDWVYKKGWLDGFFNFLNSERCFVKTMHSKDIFPGIQSRGQVKIPPFSYSEMMEWSQGSFNNFFKIYPESNLMRNRMLDISNRVDEASRKPSMTSAEKDAMMTARAELYKSQSGCAYWHGVFGGIYLHHLRSGVYRHLIMSEQALEKISPVSVNSITAYDYDDDKENELILRNEHINLYVKSYGKGTIFELDDKKRELNLMNSLTRRRESYHTKLLSRKQTDMAALTDEIRNGRNVNIHDVLGIKRRSLKEVLIYDTEQKCSFADHFISKKIGARDYFRGALYDLKTIYNLPNKVTMLEKKDYKAVIIENKAKITCDLKDFELRISKEIQVGPDKGFRVIYNFQNDSEEPFKAVFATEINWSIFSKKHSRPKDMKCGKVFRIKDEWSGANISHRFDRSIRIWTAPVYTINESEGGLDKTYQGLSAFIVKKLALRKGKTETFSIAVNID